MKVESKDFIKSFLSIDIIHNGEQHLIALNQDVYIDHLVSEFGLTDVHTIPTPLDKTLSLLKIISDEKMCNPEYYQHLIRSLNHLIVFTCPDIVFAAFKLAQFNSNPTAIHLITVLHVLRYLKDTRNLSIIYKRQKHKQTMFAHSSTDLEYMIISDASREALARIQFFQELSILSASILILADSNMTLDIAKDGAINYRKAKHIDIKYHAIRHYIQEEKVTVDHIPNSENIADLFTKALGSQKHQ